MLRRSVPGQYEIENSADELDKLDFAKGRVVPHSSHDKLNQIFAPADVGKILKAEFEARQGKMIVSGKAFLPP